MNQRVMLTKRLLKESLLKLLQKKRINQVSVKELCTDSGINRSTFYAHYGEPRDVLLDIERNFTEEILNLMQKNRESSQKERLLKVCEFLYSHIELVRILYANNFDEDIAKLFGNANFILWNPEQYFDNKVFKTEKDKEFTSVFINYGMYHVLKKWLMTDTKITPNEITEIISRIVLK